MPIKPQGRHQKLLAKLAPEMNPVHLETLAIGIGSDLTGMPYAFFEEIADLARRMGADGLADFHSRQFHSHQDA